MNSFGKKFLFLIISILSTTGLQAQTTVTGVVKDSISGEGEPYATVRLTKDGGKNQLMSLTDLDGVFSQDIKAKGTYTLSITAVGRKEIRRTVNVSGKQETVNLGTLLICDDTNMLASVEVVAQRPLVKMETDKMTYSVEADADSKSSTVLDMLRKVPMVVVDGQDNITVNGSSSFKVYVDGKPNMMMTTAPSQVFKSMPASVVQSIEVVTNPGAKYDAEGSGGVLNIITNKQKGQTVDMDGYSGQIRANAGNKGWGGGVFVSGQQGRFSWNANGMYNNMSTNGTTVDMYMEQQMTSGTAVTHYYQKGKTKIPFGMGNIGMGYELDSMSSVNLSLSVTRFQMKNTGNPTSEMYGGIYGSGFSYSNSMMMRDINTNFNGTIDYQRFFNKDRTHSLTLTYMLNYSPRDNDNDREFKEATDETLIDLTDRRSRDEEKTTEHTAQIDYSLPVAKGHTLNTGLKYMNRLNTSDARYYLRQTDEYVLDEASGMDYEYRNNILAAYAEWDAKFGKFGAKGGLRYEHTWQDVKYKSKNGTDFKKDYGTLVPTASISYSIGMSSNIGINYNMRISRPGISYLNPYVDKSNPMQLTYGNTDLDVEKNHTLGLVYNMFSQKFMLNMTLQQVICNNGIEQYSFLDADNMQNTTYGNIVKRSTTNLNVFANWSITPKTRLMLNGGVGYADMNSDQLNQKNHGWQYNAMLGLQQTLPWELKVSCNLFTNSKHYTLQGYTGGFNMLMGSLSKSILHDKLTFSVMAMTGLSRHGKLKLENYSSSPTFVSRQTIKVPMANVNFTVSWSFNKGAYKQKTHESKVNSDVIEHQSTEERIGNFNMGM